ncbi:unnamed protein product [Caenorhabditis auriculariae]|uniref:Saposin B-type domain-containing protein n=1 Tax=Caenorhabditis auriculariae TaxID=2777116 RepID=A0A8S1GVU9_9PELO|nr:unnamed protein product [Caenorhabditis auriculariae]
MVHTLKNFIILLSVIGIVSSFATTISCAFCVSGVASINQKINSNPDMKAQLGVQMSMGCDQITVQMTRQLCRESLNDNFNVFYANFSMQPDQEPSTLCKSMGYCS